MHSLRLTMMQILLRWLEIFMSIACPKSKMIVAQKGYKLLDYLTLNIWERKIFGKMRVLRAGEGHEIVCVYETSIFK